MLGFDHLPTRQSGELEATEGFTVIGPRNAVWVPRGAIIGAPHLHVPRYAELAYYSSVLITIKSSSASWPCTVPVKVGDHRATELHLDREVALGNLGPGPYYATLTNCYRSLRQEIEDGRTRSTV